MTNDFLKKSKIKGTSSVAVAVGAEVVAQHARAFCRSDPESDDRSRPTSVVSHR